MISIRVTPEGPPLGPQVVAELEKQKLRLQQTIKKTADVTAANILERGRADISAAGKFGTRWTSGLTAPVTQTQDSTIITVQEAAPHWQVFQYGAVIKGNPLLYFAPNRPIFYKGKTTTPKVISKYQVTIPKKFHLIEIVQDVAGRVGALFRATMSTGQ